MRSLMPLLPRFGRCFVFASFVSAAACSAPPPATPPAPAKKLPAIVLGDKGAFPLKAHLESADIAAGKYTPAQFIESGADSFHTPFNGLDGVGDREGEVRPGEPVRAHRPDRAELHDLWRVSQRAVSFVCRARAQLGRARPRGRWQAAVQRALRALALRRRPDADARRGDDGGPAGRSRQGGRRGKGVARQASRRGARGQGHEVRIDRRHCDTGRRRDVRRVEGRGRRPGSRRACDGMEGRRDAHPQHHRRRLVPGHGHAVRGDALEDPRGRQHARLRRRRRRYGSCQWATSRR